MLTCEILLTKSTAARGLRLFRALEQQAKLNDVRVRITQRYEGKCDWLMLYGMGGADRLPAFNEHLAQGKRCITWDIGYWARERMLRVSIDANHPQDWIWRKMLPSDRIAQCKLPIRDIHNPDGPIIFACMGKKSQALYGDFDRGAIESLRRRFPGKDVIVREKPGKDNRANMVTIAQQLEGASFVSTHHSNVAIDAIIAGIPFECVDGAAMAYRGDRDSFLRQLAWFQWSHEEADGAWKFLRYITDQ